MKNRNYSLKELTNSNFDFNFDTNSSNSNSKHSVKEHTLEVKFGSQKIEVKTVSQFSISQLAISGLTLLPADQQKWVVTNKETKKVSKFLPSDSDVNFNTSEHSVKLEDLNVQLS